MPRIRSEDTTTQRVVPDYGSSVKRTLKAWGDPRRQFFFATFNKSQQKRRVLFEIDKTRGTYGPRTATVEAYVERHIRVLQFDG